MLRFSRWLARLPFGDLTRRAFGEVAADWHHEARAARGRAVAGALAGFVRIVLSSFGSFEEHPMRNLGRDVRYAWRRLLAAPAFSVFAILTLAFGIGATTAVASSVAAMFRPYAIRNIDEVVNLYQRRPPQGSLTSSDYDYIAAHQTVFTQMFAWARTRLSWSGATGASVVQGEAVSGTYFDLVGAPPLMGRPLAPADDRPGTAPVVVISETMWRSRFAADPAIVGRAVRLNGRAFEIVGVMPRWFTGVDMPNFAPTPYWITLAQKEALEPTRESGDRQLGSLHAKGRLVPGVTIDQAAAELAGFAAHLDRADPQTEGYVARSGTGRQFQLIPTARVRLWDNPVVDDPFARMGAVVVALTALVLLVACTNLANLTLARGATRRRELAVRRALGGSRLRLIREQVVEAAVIGAAGGFGGVLIARAFMAVLGTQVRVGGDTGILVNLDPRLEPVTLLVALSTTMLAVLVFGLWPAITATRVRPRQALATDGAGSLPRWRGRRALIVGQVVVSVLLLALAAAFMRDALQVARRDPGLDLDRLAVVRVDLPGDRYDEASGRRLLDLVQARTRQLPGVESVSVSSGLPVGLGTPGGAVRTGVDPWQRVEFIAGTPGVFDTLGVRLVAGRLLSPDDRDPADTVVVVSAVTARALFDEPAGAVGRSVQFRRTRWAGDADTVDRMVRIVGVVDDMDVGAQVGSRDHGVLFMPFAQLYETRYLSVLARTSAEPAATAGLIRRAIGDLDPDVPVPGAGSGTELGGTVNSFLNIAGGFTSILGVVALALAMAGLYGVLSQVVAARTREIGVRMTLGATRARILRLVVSDGMWPVVGGTVAGLGVAWFAEFGVGRVFGSRVPEIGLVLFVLLPLPLVLAGLAACYLPARRAARVDPSVALRDL
ncbi:MAG: ADOP family duplicated permease [Vicinamibacterales bacterium]